VVNQAYHHALLAHGHGVAAVREHGGRRARVGLVTNGLPFIPATGSAADIRAAARLFARENDPHHAPVFLGRYPSSLMRSPDAPQVTRGDLALIAQRTDFFGLNCYLASYARATGTTARALEFTPDHPRAQPRWLALTHDAIYWGVRQFTERYGMKSVFITENGAAFVDPAPGADGTIADLHRLDYLRGHVQSAHRAVTEGLPLHGYFAWSFLDNFEWARGYAERFGLVHVDFSTQRRTPKLSGLWYAELMRRNAIV
jgi:beta-glucosidase